MKTQVQSLVLLNGLRIWHCHELWCSSDPVLLWLCCRPAATAPIWPLAWGPPYAANGALKSKKKKKKIQTNENNYLGLILINCHEITYLSPPSSPIVTGRCIVLCHHSLSINGLSFKKERRDHKSFKEFWIGVPKKKRIYYNSAARVHNQNIHLANQWRQQLKMGISF